MKMDDLQRLLQKYQEGSLSPEENAELDRLTHKSEVLSTAFERADGIVRRRRMRTVSLAVMVMALAGAGAWMLMPGRVAETPLVAEASIPEPGTTPSDPEVEKTELLSPTVAASTEEAKREPVQLAAAAVPKAVKSASQQDGRKDTKLEQRDLNSKSMEKNIVVCNTQCEADSVISSIWKFLSA